MREYSIWVLLILPSLNPENPDSDKYFPHALVSGGVVQSDWISGMVHWALDVIVCVRIYRMREYLIWVLLILLILKSGKS